MHLRVRVAEGSRHDTLGRQPTRTLFGLSLNLGGFLPLARLRGILGGTILSRCVLSRCLPAMQSVDVLGDELVEGLALDLGELELLLAGLARAVGTGKGASAPGGATADLGQSLRMGKAFL